MRCFLEWLNLELICEEARDLLYDSYHSYSLNCCSFVLSNLLSYSTSSSTFIVLFLCTSYLPFRTLYLTQDNMCRKIHINLSIDFTFILQSVVSLLLSSSKKDSNVLGTCKNVCLLSWWNSAIAMDDVLTARRWVTWHFFMFTFFFYNYVVFKTTYYVIFLPLTLSLC